MYKKVNKKSRKSIVKNYQFSNAKILILFLIFC